MLPLALGETVWGELQCDSEISLNGFERFERRVDLVRDVCAFRLRCGVMLEAQQSECRVLRQKFQQLLERTLVGVSHFFPSAEIDIFVNGRNNEEHRYGHQR